MVTSLREPVVVGVDGTLGSIGALDLAADEAMARVVPLVVLSIVAGGPAAVRSRHARLLDLAVSRAAAEHPGLSVTGELLYGSPAEILVERSRGASLVVVGHAHTGEPAVAREVAARASAPVIVYRPFSTQHDDARPRPVFVGVEDLGHGRGAFAFAAAEAALRGAPLSAVSHADVLAGLVGASRDAALVVVDTSLGAPVIDGAGCPVGVVRPGD